MPVKCTHENIHNCLMLVPHALAPYPKVYFVCIDVFSIMIMQGRRKILLILVCCRVKVSIPIHYRVLKFVKDILLRSDIHDDKLIVMASDGASAMKSLSKLDKEEINSNVLHARCMAHMLMN